MGIRESIAAIPKAGTFKEVDFTGIGTVRIKRLSMAEIVALPDTDVALNIIIASACDENGKPLFAAVDEVKLLKADLGFALITECAAVNNMTLAAAEKK